ncbi:MAG: ATP-binding protein [Fidelibacterota bacterium]
MNPFKYGKIVEKEDFCNRNQELQFLKRKILNNQSVWLYSPRRYGKSSLLLKAFGEIEDIKTIYFDLYNILTLSDFAQQYSDAISKELFDWQQDMRKLLQNLGQYYAGLSPSITLDETGAPTFRLEKSFLSKKANIGKILSVPEEIGKRNNIHICIAFDEFQEYKRIDPFLVNQMRSIFQTQKNVSYIFMGSKQSLMQSIFSDPNSPFYEFGEKMTIAPIVKKDWIEFISNKFNQTHLKIKKKTIDEILEISKGHPHYTQYFSSVVWNLINEGVDQNPQQFLQQWLGRIINSQSDIFQNILDQLTNNQRKVLLALSTSDSLQLYGKETADKFNFPSDSTLNEAVKGLLKKDIIIKKNGYYQLANIIMKEWLKKISA